MIKENIKNVIKKNASYFIIMAILGSVGTFALLSENNNYYESRSNVVLLPRNIKTAIHLDTLRENVVDIFTDNRELQEGVIFELKNKSSLVDIKIKNNSELTATRLNQETTREFITTISKYYDIKNDVEVRIANRSVLQKNTTVMGLSLLIGIGIAIIAQLLIVITEIIFERKAISKKNKEVARRSKKTVKSVLSKNKERIKKLSSSTKLPKKKKKKKIDFQKERRAATQAIGSIIARIKKSTEENENKKKNKEEVIEENFIEFGGSFKKASFPNNLPIAPVEDRIDPQQILSSEATDFEKLSNKKQKVVTSESTKPANELVVNGNNEPSEEEFKRRLNQLLKGK